MQLVVCCAVCFALFGIVNGLNASLVDGTFTVQGQSPKEIGNLASSINNVLAPIFSNSPPSPPKHAVLINSTVEVEGQPLLNYITISGNYSIDEPLLLFPQLLFVLNGAILIPHPSFAGAAMVISNRSAFSGVISRSGLLAGQFLCNPQTGPSPTAIVALQSPYFLIDSVLIDGCGLDGASAIHVRGVPMVTGAEIANSVISNSNRAIWLETIQKAYIHGNICFQNKAHTIDFDAYSSHSTAFNNTVYDNSQEGIFIEQSATYITVVGNTLGPNNSVGVAVYNNDIGNLCGPHIILNNLLIGNRFAGVSVGSTAPRAGAEDMDVSVLSNTFRDNGGDAAVDIHSNGGQTGTWYADNSAPSGVSKATLTSTFFGNITIFDPRDRLVVSETGKESWP